MRLQAILPSLISLSQSGFLKGRDIADNCLLAQELIQSLDRKARGHNLVFKFDMMKAFDRVSWNFLQLLLAKFGFHSLFILFNL